MPSPGAVEAARAVIAAGFPPSARAVAVAVAGAESSWNPHARAGRCGGNANPCAHACKGLCWWGPWQINICSQYQLLERLTRRTSPCYWASWLANWTNSARVAYTLSHGGQDWRPWGAYTSGAYRRYLSDAEQAVAQVVVSQSTARTTTVRDVLLASSIGAVILIGISAL